MKKSSYSRAKFILSVAVLMDTMWMIGCKRNMTCPRNMRTPVGWRNGRGCNSRHTASAHPIATFAAGNLSLRFPAYLAVFRSKPRRLLGNTVYGRSRIERAPDLNPLLVETFS